MNIFYSLVNEDLINNTISKVKSQYQEKLSNSFQDICNDIQYKIRMDTLSLDSLAKSQEEIEQIEKDSKRSKMVEEANWKKNF